MEQPRKQIGTLLGKPIYEATEPLIPQGEPPMHFQSLADWQQERKREIAKQEYAKAVTWPLDFNI